VKTVQILIAMMVFAIVSQGMVVISVRKHFPLKTAEVMVSAWAMEPASVIQDGKEKAARLKHVTTAALRNGKVLPPVFAITTSASVCQDTEAPTVNRKHVHTVVMSQMVSVTVQMVNATVRQDLAVLIVPLSL
jgi:hypothetical protein